MYFCVYKNQKRNIGNIYLMLGHEKMVLKERAPFINMNFPENVNFLKQINLEKIFYLLGQSFSKNL